MDEPKSMMCVGEHRGTQILVDVPESIHFKEYSAQVGRLVGCINLLESSDDRDFARDLHLVHRCEELANGEIYTSYNTLPSKLPGLQRILTIERIQVNIAAAQMQQKSLSA